MKLHRLMVILCISWQVALPQTTPSTSPQAVDLASVETAAIQSIMSVSATISTIFQTYLGTTSAFYPSFLSWMGSHNNWVLASPADLTAPVNVASSMQIQATQNINFNAGQKPTQLPTMNVLTQKVLLGVLYPLASSSNPTSNSELSFYSLQDADFQWSSNCNGQDWVNRFSSDDFNQICDTSQQSKVNTILSVLSKYKSDLDYMRRLTFYYTQLKNCSNSISALKNSTSSSSGSSSMGGQTVPDASSISGSSNIPYVQCWFNFSSSQPDELASIINKDLQQSCSSLTNSSTRNDCTSLQSSFNDYASQASTALKGIQYIPDQDNGVNAAYSSIVQSMINDLQNSLTNAQDAVYAEIFNDSSIINATPLMESIYPSMDNLILPTQYGTQVCNPLNADQDTSFDYFYTTDTTSLDYAYSFITNLDLSVASGLTLSQTVGLAPISDATSNAPPIYIHGGRYLYCDSGSSSDTSSSVYSNLCEDSKDNVYTTNLTSLRSGLFGTIATSREILSEQATLYLANRSAAYSNLLNMYDKRALVGNKSGCTPAQLAEYHATWRYQKKDDQTPSWQETVRTDSTLTQMDLMREAVLLLQDINYQLHQLNQTAERSMSIESITSMTKLQPIASQMNSLSSTISSSIATYDTGYSNQTSTSSGQSN